MRSLKLVLAALAVVGFAYGETPDQFKVQATAPPVAESLGGGEPLTFEFKNAGKTFYTGLNKALKSELQHKPAKRFLEADVKVPATYHIRDLAKKLGVELTGTFDQKQCGSCVYNSVSRNAADHLRLRKQDVPVLSRQYAMGLADWSCSGSLFEKVAGALVRFADVSELDYPYRAVDQRLKDVSSFKKYGPFKSFQIIDNSPKSIMSALVQGYPVSVTVAADGPWSSYSGGVYNRRGSTATNHEVLIYGGWCGPAATDKDGNCVFDSRGYPVNGDGGAVVENSWNTSWGENGAMRTLWGLNALAEEAGVLESGIPLPDPTPPPPPPPPPTPTPTPFTLQAWMIYAGLGLLGLIVVLQLVLSVKKPSVKK